MYCGSVTVFEQAFPKFVPWFHHEPNSCFLVYGISVKHVQMTCYIWLHYDFVMFFVLHISFAVGQFIH